jgi:HlyD family secretion protein
MSTSRRTKGSARLITTVSIAVMLLVGSTGLWLFQGGPGAAKSAEDQPVYTVQRGDLPITLRLKGEFQAEEAQDVRFEAQGRANITWLVEEGSRVKKGDKVVELDSTDLVKEIEQLETNVEKATAQLTVSKANEVISKLDAESKIRKAKMDLVMAQLELKKFQSESGTQDKEIRDAKLKIKQAQVKRDKAKSIDKNMPDLFKQGFVTEEEVAQSKLDVETAINALDTALLESKILKEYTHPMQDRKLKDNLARAEAELKRFVKVAERVKAQTEASRTNADQHYNRQVERLKDAKERLSKMTLFAPSDGIVIYGGSRRRWWQDEIKVGANAHRHQVLMRLPNLDTMQVVVKIHEADIGRIRVEKEKPQEVILTSDMRPGKQFKGFVHQIATLAQGERGREHVKRFTTTIRIEKRIPGVRPGMTAGVEILIAQLEDVVYVPIQAVQTYEGKSYCFLPAGDEPERREVVVGRSSIELAEIKQGLKEGERVLLAPPKLRPDVDSEDKTKTKRRSPYPARRRRPEAP